MKRKKTSAFYNFWAAAIILSLFFVVFALVFVTVRDGGGSESTSPDLSPGTSASAASDISPGTSAHATPNPGGETPPPEENPPAETPVGEPPPLILAETEDMGQEYIDKFIFLGDSTTNGLAHYEIVDRYQVWTPKSGTFSLFNQSIITIEYKETGEELTIEEILERKKPEYLLITLGVNGVAMMGEEYFVSEYVRLIERIQAASPDTKIIVNSMYPVCTFYTKISNDTISLGNTWLPKVAEQTGTRFLDSAAALRGDNGYLPDNLTNGDGLHLTGEALGQVIDYVRTHGYK